MDRLLAFVVTLTVCSSLVLSAATERRTSRVRADKKIESNPLHRLSLPSNASAIRSDITDNFSCANKAYGYYADVENDCQIFHVCLPVTFGDGRERMYRWSFICPEETAFSQEAFTCVRNDEIAFDCATSERFYDLNRNIGAQEEVKEIDSNELGTATTSANRRNQPGNKNVQSNRTTPTTISTAAAPKITKVMSTATPRPTTPAIVTNANVFTTKRSRHPTASTLPIATVPKETNTLLDGALRQDNPSKKSKRPAVVETTTIDRPTTIITEEVITESAATTNLPQTTISQTTPEFLYTRIVPELLQKNDKVTIDTVEPLFSTLINAQTNNEADELIRNIKHLQNDMLLSIPTSENSAATPIAVEIPTPTANAPLPRRFLFKADAIKNRLKH